MKIFLFALSAALFLTSCSAKKTWQANKIEQQEKSMIEDAKQGKVDSVAVEKLLQAYMAFADKYPNDTLSANFLFKAADFYRYMGKPLKSIGVYERIYNDFPTCQKRPYALFLQGFLFENEVKNYDAAKIKYEEFLKQYPEHPIAKDVQLALANLGKSADQLMAEFNDRERQDSIRALVKK